MKAWFLLTDLFGKSRLGIPSACFTSASSPLDLTAAFEENVSQLATDRRHLSFFGCSGFSRPVTSRAF